MVSTIKKATTADIPVIKSMADVVFSHTYSNILTKEQIEYMMEWMYSSKSLDVQISEGHTFYISYINDTPCGYMSIKKENTADNNIVLFHLHKLYVMPEFQGSGVGRALFEQACNHATENCLGNRRRIELNVNRYNKALEFYRRMGMEIVCDGDFPIGRGYYMNDYIMGLEL